MPPIGDWTTWLLLGGRGSGKTRAGAEWVRGMVTGDPFFTPQPVGRVALVADTFADGREVMVEGESGLLSIHPRAERPSWISSRKRLEWKNGAIAQIFSSEDPEALRGPQFEVAWSDELAKWRHADETWNMLQFGMRLGRRPRQMVTTTPRPTPLLKRLLQSPDTSVVKMRTEENEKNLAPQFLDSVVAAYRGTQLGRQELDGDLLDDRPDALWQRDQIDQERLTDCGELERIVVAVDPPVTGTEKSDACGIIVAGSGRDGRFYVLADHTIRAVSPEKWSNAAVHAFDAHAADIVVIETNQGGDMAESVLRHVRRNLPIRQVKANRGKWLRAEPVAQLYERGLVSHVGRFCELEDELTDFGLDGLSGGHSPDRLDALVWALTELALLAEQHPRVRTL